MPISDEFVLVEFGLVLKIGWQNAITIHAIINILVNKRSKFFSLDFFLDSISMLFRRDKSEKYFQSRPRLSQISVLASNQSEILSNRKELEDIVISLEKKYEGKEIPVPDYWGGYRLEHKAVEFWQGRRDRMHDRFLYTLHGTTWQIERLAP